jgi:uncharacterized membrane protein
MAMILLSLREGRLLSRNAAGGVLATCGRMPPAPPAEHSTIPAADNIRAIIKLERQAQAASRWPEKVSDAISAFAGSLWFVLCHVLAFTAWASWNALGPRSLRFDPYPYGLLTFLVSMEGVLIASFVLIAQNRMSAQSDRRDHLNLQVDLLAEQEMTIVLRMLRRISERLSIEIENADDRRAETLAEETNVYELMQTLDKELPGREQSDDK